MLTVDQKLLESIPSQPGPVGEGGREGGRGGAERPDAHGGTRTITTLSCEGAGWEEVGEAGTIGQRQQAGRDKQTGLGSHTLLGGSGSGSSVDGQWWRAGVGRRNHVA